MKQKIELEPSEELAYWIGIVQTDGSLKEYVDSNGKSQFIISFCVSPKSLPMVQRFRELSAKIFNRYCNLTLDKRTRFLSCGIGVKRLLKTFENLDITFKDPPIPPKWVLEKPKFFGSYLAGVIDGDGCIYFNKSRNSTQCRIQITSGDKQIRLADSIRKLLNCGVSIQDGKERVFTLRGQEFSGKSFDLIFNVSQKNIVFIKNFMMTAIQISRKRQIIEKFMELRGWSQTGN